MLVDLIDYIQPTLVIIGSRGLNRLKGVILGSMSHYLIQKSSSPVMVSQLDPQVDLWLTCFMFQVTRRRLKPLRRPKRPISDLQREPRVGGLANATIDVESHARMVPPTGSAEEKQEEQKRTLASEGDGDDTDAEGQPANHNAL